MEVTIPVAEVVSGWSIVWVGCEPIATVLARHPEIRIGSKLYSAPAGVKPLSEDEIQDAVDAATVAFRLRPQGPGGQMLTTYDDWNHWFAKEIERKHGINP